MSEDPVIAWTRPMLERFKVARTDAGGKNFTFDGHEFVSNYAKYLIEYLEAHLPAEADADGGEKN